MSLGSVQSSSSRRVVIVLALYSSLSARWEWTAAVARRVAASCPPAIELAIEAERVAGAFTRDALATYGVSEAQGTEHQIVSACERWSPSNITTILSRKSPNRATIGRAT